MAQSKASAKIDEHDIGAVPAVVSTTEEVPAKADESSYPGPNDAEIDQPPVRTHRPDVPIAQTLVAGAGEHQPPDPKEVDAQGRAIYDEKAASEKGEPARVSAREAEKG